MRHLIAIDTETTGLNPSTHQLMTASFVPIDDTVPPLTLYVLQDEYNWTTVAREYFSQYREEWRADAKPIMQARAALLAYLDKWFPAGEIVWVGHNVSFDISFLKQLSPHVQLPRVSHRSIDTHSLLSVLALLAKIPESACTSTGAFEYFGVTPPVGARHTSLGDAQATRDLFLKVVHELDTTPKEGSTHS